MDKLICVGKNYLEHARELGDAVPERPVLFLKPPSVLRTVSAWGETLSLRLPEGRGEVHHECEIVLKLEAGSIVGVSLGLDMTLRNVQAELKKHGHPWEIGKVFIDAAVCGPIIPIAEFPDYLDTEFTLSLNGNVKQRGLGREMRQSPAEVLEYAAACFPISEGDLVFTGTPAGVGPVQRGDRAEVRWGAYHYSVIWGQ